MYVENKILHNLNRKAMYIQRIKNCKECYLFQNVFYVFVCMYIYDIMHKCIIYNAYMYICMLT